MGMKQEIKSLTKLGDQNWTSLQVCKMGYEIEEVWGSAEDIPAQSCDKSITSNNPASLKSVVSLARSKK